MGDLVSKNKKEKADTEKGGDSKIKEEKKDKNEEYISKYLKEKMMNQMKMFILK